MNAFDNFFDEEELFAPESLKDMLVSEIELIRDSMVIVNMFLGEPIKTGLKYLQEFEQKKQNR